MFFSCRSKPADGLSIDCAAGSQGAGCRQGDREETERQAAWRWRRRGQPQKVASLRHKLGGRGLGCEATLKSGDQGHPATLPWEPWAPSLAHCVSLSKSPHLSEALLFSSRSHPCRIYSKGLLGDLNEIMGFKCLRRFLAHCWCSVNVRFLYSNTASWGRPCAQASAWELRSCVWR